MNDVLEGSGCGLSLCATTACQEGKSISQPHEYEPVMPTTEPRISFSDNNCTTTSFGRCKDFALHLQTIFDLLVFCRINATFSHVCHAVSLLCWPTAASEGGDDHNMTINDDMSNNGSSSSKPKCEGRKTLDACLQQLPPILDQAEMTGIPSSKKDVEASCR